MGFQLLQITNDGRNPASEGHRTDKGEFLFMPAEFIDLLSQPELDIGHSKKVLFSSDHFHTWVHGDYPGTKGPMHKHTADQQFYCVQGECTFHFSEIGRASCRERV